ncbi:YceH family protein [Synoicihabitans lomoniglobus]|uniref:YceH family protein n=1 Tax=Synoicihabitans lomoniglobus TaxID=2909285 RepID=A0AAE9ZSA5_9BACT|nr:YceH family protein [Opitutaceae bacterium LMO-M01]WED63316.1 YceH family protein [Opitutaceae bacterium LMO-M01]
MESNAAAAPETNDVVLSPLEARVLGCLIEKEATTPDVYPLSLNSLINACNQKNNRAPLMSVGEEEVAAAIELLRAKHLVTLFSGAGARSVKYRHKFTEAWPVEPVAVALLAELMLRGPQTAAGLRGNCERLVAIPDLAEFEAVLNDLTTRGSGALVRKLERQPGQKEARWGQLIAEDPVAGALASEQSTGGSAEGGRSSTVKVALTLPPEAEARIATLETQVAELKAELARLREALGE